LCARPISRARRTPSWWLVPATAVEASGSPAPECRALLAGRSIRRWVRELERRDIVWRGHESRELSTDILDHSDLVLTMEFTQHMRILEHWPQATGVFGLRQFAQAVQGEPGGRDIALSALSATVLPNSLAWDVRDPYGRGARPAAHCAMELDVLIRQIFGRLLGDPAEPVPTLPAAETRRHWWNKR